MSFIPYQDPRPARKRPPLDRGQIVRAALALLDEVGLDGLTMRNLAERLGIQAASLYRHIADKEDLLVLLADEISGEIPLAQIPAEGATARDDWQRSLIDLARRYRQVLRAHRDAARLFASTRPAGPRRLRHIEAILTVLLAAGFAPRDAMSAGYHFNNLVTEFVADEARIAEAAAVLGLSLDAFVAQARAHLRALPADDYPNLTQFAEHVVEGDSEGLFQFGLDLLISGLEQLRRPS